jgi:hypothetical protein
MSDTVYKLIHFQPVGGYKTIGEFDTEEKAEWRKAEELKSTPDAVLTIAQVPRVEKLEDRKDYLKMRGENVTRHGKSAADMDRDELLILVGALSEELICCWAKQAAA